MAKVTSSSHQPSSNNASDSETSPKTTSIPTITLPKGGGAIRGMGEKFSANPVTGTGSISVPIATSSGRSGFGPELSLSYDSGSGTSPFGFGWSLSLPSITRKTDKGLPRYLDAEESDTFILSGAEDLVPILVKNDQGEWERENLPLRVVGGIRYRIQRYRPRIEGLFARIECWTNTRDMTDVFWRSISKDDITTWYGRTAESRIADPSEPSHIFSWLICESHDDKGNVIVYGYKVEDSAEVLVDSSGKRLPKAHERNRTDKSRSAQRYLKRIRYGNRSPYFPELKSNSTWPIPPDAYATDGSNSWHFEAVFDYGEHNTNSPTSNAATPWTARPDPFSSYRAGFEVRTYRTCQRILMFHHFPDEAGVGRNCLVRSTDFTYSDEVDPTDVRNPVYTFLRAVTQTGYRRNNNGYDQRRLPPVEFEYAQPIVQEIVEEIDSVSLENLPIGLDGSVYRWTDLHGEGIPGILTEQAGFWLYKRNLSPIPDKTPGGRELVKAKFAPLETVALKPNIVLSAGSEFMDLAGDGQPDLVVMNGPMPGLYEHDESDGWQPFRPFTSRLNRDTRDPNVKFIDLNGDGHTDVLITEDHAFVWHVSLAEEGFGPAQRVAQALDEEKGPRVVFADGTQSIYLADLSGDGLTDIVRIRNGEVCYWPNLGYGRFGSKVTMDNAPWFDNPDQFDHKRIRLADIDGSGTTDIIYLHRDGVRLYFNQSGNSWSKSQSLNVFTRINGVVNIVPIDLLGNGTACLVWSSSLPGDAHHPMRYVNLMGGQKPHLLVKTINNLGAETQVDYAPSTKFYLLDKQAGTPWITRLPFPVHIVEKVTTFDHVSRNRFVTSYAYHHGYFDGEEREFRGFGMVEQWDTERFADHIGGSSAADNIAAESHVPPVHTKTWFHTGVYLGRERISRHFENEYFTEIGLTRDSARPLLLDDTVIPSDLTMDEEREACRALKGSMLRQEVYADDADHTGATPMQIQRAQMPYTVTEQNFTIRTVQPRADNRHAVFFTHAREAISYHYERNPADPRIQHALTLEVDPFGNVLKQVSIGYGRRQQIRVVDDQGNVQQVPNPGLTELDPTDQTKQTIPLLTYTENSVTNAIETTDQHRTPMPSETITYELTGYTATGSAGRFQISDFVEPDPATVGRLRHRFTAPDVAYEATASGSRRRRPIEHLRTYYRPDDLGASAGNSNRLLGPRELEPMALPGETYKLAFTPGLLDAAFLQPQTGQLPEELRSAASRTQVIGGKRGDQGGYVDLDGNGHWWLPSGRSFFSAGPRDSSVTELTEARKHFFLLRRYRDPFDQDTVVDFDAHDLLMVETRDALDNRVTVEVNDYRVLQPRLVSDPNQNRTEVAFDIQGMVVATAVMGKNGENKGDLLEGFNPDPLLADLQAFIAAPHAQAASLLGKATTRIVYDLERYQRAGQPPFAATLARETHFNDPGGPQTKIQISFSYSDGFGREIQKKIQAEAGDAPQRQTSIPLPTGDIRPGDLVTDAQGKPVQANTPRRWVGSGRIVFNNKGKPVKQYEPFFSATHLYESELEMTDTGVSPVLFYDPAERVIATLHPNHTYEKVVFDPWQQITSDVNDNCAPAGSETGDPRTDPDIGGYVEIYFDQQPPSWQTWYVGRSGAATRAERDAAQQAAAHANTPTIAHFDVLGRPFLTIADNAADGKYETRIEQDIEGNQRRVIDAQGRLVMQYDYDMLGNRIHQASMEAGERWMLNDVTGKPIRMWDSRGFMRRMTYDALRRPTGLYVPENGTERLAERTVYGESQGDASNHRTRVYQVFDGAGIVTSVGYDFKGNLLDGRRDLLPNYKLAVNWNLNPNPNDGTYTSATTYDALNRPISVTTPDGSTYRPTYNEANLLDKVDVNLRGAAVPTPFVTNIDYDAKGQRERIVYANGAETRYTYDEQTFRLIRLATTRPTGRNGMAAIFTNAALVQDLHYTYDPAGNITRIEDKAQATVTHAGQSVQAVGVFTYDALYRLTEAQGREHIGGATFDIKPQDGNYRSYPFANQNAHPNDLRALRNYTQYYDYDEVGNITELRHVASGGGWTQGYIYDEDTLMVDSSEVGKKSNRLTQTSLGGVLGAKISYDEHGNMKTMPHLTMMDWDFEDQLQATRQQVVNGGGGATTYYVYDAAGQRVRKVTENASGRRIHERIYLGTYEIYRTYALDSTTDVERETLHVMDDKQRIALVETQTVREGARVAAPIPVLRYQISNHLGSSSLELTGDASLISYEEYHPYGTTSFQAFLGAAEVSLKRYRFTGKERDEESGFYYHGARYYAPWLGRWASTDPAGGVHSASTRDVGAVICSSLYAYVNGRVIIGNDPDGHAINLLAGAIGAGIGFVVGFGINAAVQLHSGKEFSWKSAIATGVGGAISGGIGGLTMGGSLLVQAGVGGVGASVAGGAATRQILGEKQTAEAASTDALVGLVTFGLGKGISSALSKSANGQMSTAIRELEKETIESTKQAAALKNVSQAVSNAAKDEGESLVSKTATQTSKNANKAPTTSAAGAAEAVGDVPQTTAKPSVRDTGFGDYRATYGNDPKALVSFKPTPGGVDVGDVMRGAQPPGSAGRMLAEALQSVRQGTPKTIRFSGIINETTLNQLQAGVAPGETLLGRTLANTVKVLGGKINGWSTGMSRGKPFIEAKIEY